MRVAAIDCGSNSFHLLIADAFEHDQMVVVEDDKTLLYLGAEVATTGKISPSSLERARRVMRHYKTLIKRHNVEAVKCVATSAIRTAINAANVIEVLTKTLGHQVRVISGEEEAKTIFRAISAVSSLPESRILACDMGGGSLEIMAGQRYGLEHAFSAPLGASRVARTIEVSDPLCENDISYIIKEWKKYFGEFGISFPANLFSHVVVSSGTLTSLITVARAMVDGHIAPPLVTTKCSAVELKSACEEIIRLPSKKRKKILGYDKTRDEYMPTAAVIALEISKLVSPDASWIISPYALREGMVLRIADEYNDEVVDQYSAAKSTIDDLENRMSAFTPTKHHREHNQETSPLVVHGRKVGQLAQQLFDGLQIIHNLPERDKTILGYAGRLHDIGETISHSKHDQHGAYILSSIPLVGFSPEEAILLRGIVRWHRTRDPRSNERFVGRMDDLELQKAKWLSAIIRIADGADAGKSRSIETLNVTVHPDVIFIRCSTKTDSELELYSARRKRDLLEEVSGRDVVIEPLIQQHQPQQD